MTGPDLDAEAGCERVLRSLSPWFGIEKSLVDYVRATSRHPTFSLEEGDELLAFLTLWKHFPESWEVHCIAVHADHRGRGLGRRLHEHAERWLAAAGCRILQVKTLAADHPSPEYAETRAFYERLGYSPLEVHPMLWDPKNPALQLVKWIGR